MATGYRIQVQGPVDQPWSTIDSGFHAQGVALKRAEQLASRTRTVQGEKVPIYTGVRLLLGHQVLASWTNGRRDLRGSEA